MKDDDFGATKETLFFLCVALLAPFATRHKSFLPLSTLRWEALFCNWRQVCNFPIRFKNHISICIRRQKCLWNIFADACLKREIAGNGVFMNVSDVIVVVDVHVFVLNGHAFVYTYVKNCPQPIRRWRNERQIKQISYVFNRCHSHY